MKDLFSELDKNTEALNQLKGRYNETLISEYYSMFKVEFERQQELDWVNLLIKRVLRMRYRILENISREVTIEKNNVSVQTRDLNTIVV